MPKYVCMGATLKCTFGMTPSTLMVTVPLRPMIQNKPKATIMDFVPLANILPFGMSPMPCVPAIVAPWTPGGKELITNMPALLDNCKLMCMWGGNISITMPGHTCDSQGK